MKDKYTVYMHVAPTGKRYIGITCQPLHLRWRGGKGYQKNPHFWRAIEKYGWDNFEHHVLLENLNKTDAEISEIALIAEHMTTDKRYGFNIENGGNAQGKISNESRKKMSISSTGKTHSEETKRKISEGGKGIKKSKETVERMREAWTGEKNHRYGKTAHNAKTIEQITATGEVIAVFASSYAAEKSTGIPSRSIRYVCAKEKIEAGGYGWRYR